MSSFRAGAMPGPRPRKVARNLRGAAPPPGLASNLPPLSRVLRQRRELRRDMREQLFALTHDRLELFLEAFAQRAPDQRGAGGDLRFFLAQERAGLLGQHHQTIVLEQNPAGAVLQHVDAAETGDAQDALRVRWRTEQVELRIAELGRAHVPSRRLAATELRRQIVHDRLELARAPRAVALRQLRLECDHRHFFTSNSSRWSSGS